MNSIERFNAERAADAEDLTGDAREIFMGLISDVYAERRPFYGFKAAIADLNAKMAHFIAQDWLAANRALHAMRLWECDQRYAAPAEAIESEGAPS